VKQDLMGVFYRIATVFPIIPDPPLYSSLYFFAITAKSLAWILIKASILKKRKTKH